jgi:nucleotide-binding universal stress UspA family protein
MKQRIDSITVGIADVTEPDPHLETVARIAGDLGATLHLVHAYTALHSLGDVKGADTDALASQHDLLRQRLQAVAARSGAVDHIVTHAVPGPSSEVILQVAERKRSDLIVVGASERAALPSLILGTTALRVLRGSTIPVLVARGAGIHPPVRVLLTTDLSSASAGVHEDALGLLRTLSVGGGLEVRSLYVGGDDVLLPSPLHQIALRDQARERLDGFLTAIPDELPVEASVRLGISAKEILAEAVEWNADLLVVGSRGRSAVSRFLIGSVAETVVRKAPCDVLLVPVRTTEAEGAAIEEPAGG